MTKKGCIDTIEVVWSESTFDLWDLRVLNKIDKCGKELSW